MWTLLLIGLFAGVQPAVEVETLDGQVIAGRLVELGADSVTIETDRGPVSLATEKLAGLRPALEQGPSGLAPGVEVELVDGSRLAAADYTAEGGRTTIAMPGGEMIELATGDVASVRLQPPGPATAAEWSRLREAALNGDLLVVRKGDSVDYHLGVLGDVSDTLVHFEIDSERLPVKRLKVHGLIYYRPAGPELAEAVCRVLDTHGSNWVARSIELAGDSLRWTTPLGVEVARGLSAVESVDFSQGKIVYLSDLKAESVEWTPYFGRAGNLDVLREFFGPREDRSLRSGPLELGGKSYRKGLALHSRTRIGYGLPGNFRRFKAIAGIDDRVRPQGNARLVLYGDGRVLLETTVRGTDPPLPIDVDLSGVGRLEILVDFGGDLDVGDHVDLCQARIVK